MDYTTQPRATYCRPEIASIGLTEAQATAAGPQAQDRQGPVPGDRQGDHRRRVRGLRQGHRRRRDQRHARRPHRRAARHRPHRRGVARLRARGDAVGDRRRDPRPSDAVRGHRRGGDGRRRAVAQLLAQAGRADARRRSGGRTSAMAVTRGATRTSAPPSACPTPTSSRCTATSRSPARSTSGCGSSTGPAGSRS